MGTINGEWKSIPVLLNSARKSISVFQLRKKKSFWADFQWKWIISDYVPKVLVCVRL